jgi:two-component system alkaline phosphatase synthesis response regulator PhoP
MNEQYNILIVDDEEDILDFLSYNLIKEGFNIYTAKNGIEAIKIASEIVPQLILLDVMMPQMDGIEACKEMRKIPSLKNVLISFLTARGEDYSQIAGFEAGADDYITKPIRPKVLISKLKALLKRIENESINEIKKVTIGDIVIDRDKFIVTKKGKEINLPRKEFALLELLTSKPDKVFTRTDIYNTIWGEDVVVGDRTIDVHIRKLREKLGDDYIKTIKGIGYKFIEK